MEITHIKKRKMWFLQLTFQEGLDLVESLSSQIANKNCNLRRLESYTPDGTYVSIAVHPDKTEVNLREQIKSLKDQLYNRSLRSWSIPPKERKRTNQKGAKHGKS